MHRAAVLTLVALIATACGSDSSVDDVVASVQVDEAHDVVVIRSVETDMTPTLLVCRVPHGETSVDTNRCADVDPWRWTRTSISANLEPGPTSSLLVVVHDEARFRVIQPTGLRLGPPVDIHLPAGPIGALAPLALKVAVAESELTADNAIGCLTTGLAGGTNPVFITATMAESKVPVTAPPTDLQTACV